MLFRIFLAGAVAWCGATATLRAQDPTDNSPYTRYGIGNLSTFDFQGVQAMGGIGTAYKTSYSLNLTNPASLAYLRTTAFEVGLFSKFTRLTANDESTARAADGNLTHLALAFPLRNAINDASDGKASRFHWAMATGIVPYSRVGYEIQTTTTQDSIGTLTNQYNGSGGTFQFFWANAFRYKRLSVGLNTGYLFGKIANERVVSIADTTYRTFSDILQTNYSFGGLVWKLGLQYEFVFGEPDLPANTSRGAKQQRTRLSLGATFNNDMKINANAENMALRSNGFYGTDTIQQPVTTEDKATLPLSYGFGAVLSKDLSWLIGADFQAAHWENYTNAVKPEKLANTIRIGFGGEWIPNYQSYNRYFKRVSYRLGGYYQTDPRVIGGEQLKGYAATVGLGLPIQVPKRGTMGYANLGFEVGSFGSDAYIRENYFKLNMGFTLNDNSWFYKRRFN